MLCENFSKLSDYPENLNKSLESLKLLPKFTLRLILVSLFRLIAIQRIWSNFLSSAAEINSQDATYVLSYSVIMLNTDLHNPQVRKRMDLQAYSRNLRGVNENKDFDPEYLVRHSFLLFLLSIFAPSDSRWTLCVASDLRVNQEARDCTTGGTPEFSGIRIWLERVAKKNSSNW